MFIPDKRKEGNGAKREGRMFQIMTVLYEDKFQSKEDRDSVGGLTSTQIARQIGLAPSWYVRDLLQEMLSVGWITGEIRDKANGASAFVWWIAEYAEFSDKWREAFKVWYPEIQQPLL